MTILPADIILKIVSLTNDKTIEALLGSCKTFRDICLGYQQTVTQNKYLDKSAFDLYGHLPQQGIALSKYETWTPKTPSGVQEKRLVFNTDDMLDSNIIFLNQDVDFVNGALVSIKVKGHVKCISLCCVHQIIQPVDVCTLSNLGILCKDTSGYTEILKPFISAINLLQEVDTILFLQTQGHIEVVISYLPKISIQKGILTRSPLVIYNKTFNSIVPQIVVIPVSCTWANDYVFICFNKRVDKQLGLIEIKDRHHNSIYKIAARRLATNFMSSRVERFAWTQHMNCKNKSVYIVPLSGDGGCFYVIVQFRIMVKDLTCSVVRWQERQ
jgi:hypothetical protein